MKRITHTLLCGMLLTLPHVSSASDYPEPDSAYWQADPRAFSCPAKTTLGAAITLKKGARTGRELAVTDPDGTYYFLVLGMPDAGMKSLMTPKALDAATAVTLETRSLTGYTGEGNGKVFQKSGTYTLYLSDNLESEDGGYRCSVRVTGG